MTSPAFGDYQLKIYGAGLRGVVPTFPMAFAELEARAAQALPPPVLSYVAGGAGSEHVPLGLLEAPDAQRPALLRPPALLAAWGDRLGALEAHLDDMDE